MNSAGIRTGSSAPPPMIKASGSKVFTISSKKQAERVSLHTKDFRGRGGRPFSAIPRTSFAAWFTSSLESSWPGYRAGSTAAAFLAMR